jgi:hypothetical protein
VQVRPGRNTGCQPDVALTPGVPGHLHRGALRSLSAHPLDAHVTGLCAAALQGEGDCSSLLDPGGSGDYLSWENAYPNVSVWQVLVLPQFASISKFDCCTS